MNTRKGFTLVELLVVIAILAILATVGVVGYTGFMDDAYQSNADVEADRIAQELEYTLKHGIATEYQLGTAGTTKTPVYVTYNKTDKTWNVVTYDATAKKYVDYTGEITLIDVDLAQLKGTVKVVEDTTSDVRSLIYVSSDKATITSDILSTLTNEK